MIEIYPNVWVGSQEDAEELLAVSNSLLVKDALISGNDVKAKEIVGYPENWFVLHCCKEPYHRKNGRLYWPWRTQGFSRIPLCPSWQQDGIKYG